MKLSPKALYHKLIPEKIRQKRWFRYTFNMYVITVVVVLVGVFILSDNSLFVLRKSNKEMENLNRLIDYYKKEIAERQELIDRLDTDTFFLETYAREKYQMTKDGEDLFVFVDN